MGKFNYIVKFTSNNDALSQLKKGDAVLFPIANTNDDFNGLIFLLELGLSPILISNDMPLLARKKLAKKHNIQLVISNFLDDSYALLTVNIDGEPLCYSPQVMGLFSSGTTGKPKLICRTRAHWEAEAQRYIKLLELSSSQTIVVPLPISHAYAMGVCLAAYIAGAHLIIFKSNMLNKLQYYLFQQVDLIILTPTLIRLLIQKKINIPEVKKIYHVGRPHRVMVGAGLISVTEENQFELLYQVPLWRNYGSSETGAIVVGEPHLKNQVLGRIMPDIQYRVLSEKKEIYPVNQIGLLYVSIFQNSWICLGDLVFTDDDAMIHYVGRKKNVLRRGDRWVSPVEVEFALLDLGGISDVSVKVEKKSGSQKESLIAYVVLSSQSNWSGYKIRQALRSYLADYLLPDAIVITHKIDRNIHGKATLSQKEI